VLTSPIGKVKNEAAHLCFGGVQDRVEAEGHVLRNHAQIWRFGAHAQELEHIWVPQAL